MIQKTLSMGKRPVYYVQKSCRNEDGKPSTKYAERLGTIDDSVICTDGGLSSYDNRKHDSVGERSFITFRPASEPTPT